MKLKSKQQEAYDFIKSGSNVFITGSSGTGKSAIIKKLKKDITLSHKKIALTSTTGTSSVLIGGVTIHSYLGIGLGRGSVEYLCEKILSKKWLLKKWTGLDILIIDEISMLSWELFDKLEEIARLVRRNDDPFGGIQLVITGDWCQLPCINCKKFCFEAKSWDKCIDKVIYLTEIIRQNDVKFQHCLNNLRMGMLDDETLSLLKTRINADLTNKHNIIPTKLFSLRSNVEDINNVELDKLAEDGRQFYEYKMETLLFDSKKRHILNNTKKYCNADSNIQLCVGAQVMLSINLDFDSKLVNGSRGIVIDFKDDMPVVKFVNGVERVIQFNSWKIEDNDVLIAEIIQIPLKIAFAISIHSCQGSTLDYVEIDLSNIFEYGQAYVALSRVKSIDGLSLKNFNPSIIKAHPDAIEYYKTL